MPETTHMSRTADQTPMETFLLFLARITRESAPVGLTIGHIDTGGMTRRQSVTIHHASPRVTEQIARAYPGAALVEATGQPPMGTPGGLRLLLSCSDTSKPGLA
jgi:hypothetical protein